MTRTTFRIASGETTNKDVARAGLGYYRPCNLWGILEIFFSEISIKKHHFFRVGAEEDFNYYSGAESIT